MDGVTAITAAARAGSSDQPDRRPHADVYRRPGVFPLAELRESSLMFSLESLLAHERDKVEHERQQAEQQRKAALEAEARAERARQAERARLAAEARELAMLEDRRQREDQARLEAIRQAELDRVRFESHLKSELGVAAHRDRHERELQAAALATRAKRLRTALITLAAMSGLVVAGTVAFALMSPRGELERLRAAAAAARTNEDARATELRNMLNDAERRRLALEAQLAAQAHAPTPSPAPAHSTTPIAPRPARPARPTSPTAPKRPTPCTGDAHDPLNPCLGG
jgi:colicin import membrane protein